MAFGLGTLLAGAGLPRFAPDLLDKAGELLFGARSKEILETAQDRLRAYTGKVPVNHELEQAIRCAELTATLVLLVEFRHKTEGEHFDTRSAVPPPFIAAAQAWLHRQMGLCPSLKAIPNDRCGAVIERALDEALSLARAAQVETSLAEAGQEVWGELVAGAAQ
jgi:hypothetical protein